MKEIKCFEKHHEKKINITLEKNSVEKNMHALCNFKTYKNMYFVVNNLYYDMKNTFEIFSL